MRRPAAVFIAVLLLLLASRTLAGSPTDKILVSGQSVLAIIDTNNDGIPDSEDCSFMGFANPLGDLVIMGMQDSHMSGGTMLRACSGDYAGEVDENFPTDTSVFAQILASNIPGYSGLPDFPTSVDGKFLPPNGGSARILSSVEIQNGLEEVIGSGSLCDSVARVMLPGGVTLALPLGLGTPGFVKVPGLALQTTAGGKVMLNAFIPQANGIVSFALQSAPLTPLIQIPLIGACARGAPTLSEWNLIALALGLLALGAWMLGRRPAFSDALPLP